MKKKTVLTAAAVFLVVVLLGLIVVSGVLLVDGKRIPKLYFEGNISGMEEKSDLRDISFEYRDGGQTVGGYAEIKIQGTSSIKFDKKNYTVKFYLDEAHEEKLAIDLGWGAQSKYCLKANWIDRTHARNVVTAKLVTQMQQKYGVLTQAPRNGAIDGFPVEIYSNGKFLGLYTLNIPKDEWQFGMDSDNPNHIVICGEGWEDANLFRAEPDFTTWSVEVGEENEPTLEKMKTLFDFVINSTDEEFTANFEDHLDLDAALNYYVMADFAYLTDNLGKNMLLATYDGQKWYPSLYDLDSSWGSDYNGKKVWEYGEHPTGVSQNMLFARIEANFPQELAQRYFELREDILTKEHVMDEFEAFRDQIPTLSFFKETVKWGTGLIRRPADLPGFDYNQIEDYLNTVIDGLDFKYSMLLQ